MYLRRVAGRSTRYYYFDLVQSWTDKTPQGVMELSFPGQRWQEASYLRFSGQIRTIELVWVVFDDGTDKSLHGGVSTAPGTIFPSGIKSVADQIKYLRDFIFTPEESTKFYLFHDTLAPLDGDGNLLQVVPKGPSFQFTGGETNVTAGNLDFSCAKNMV